MVTQFGMSDRLGPLAYGDNEEEIFLGHSIARTQNMSDETLKMVDEEIHHFVDEGYATAKTIIEEHIDELHMLAKGLLEYETLTGQEIKDLLKGKPPVRDSGDDGGNKAPASSAVPSAGAGKPREEPDDGGMEPQPQT
jgi:cell division protease FtsH